MTASAAITIDGIAEVDYGSAVSTQALGTSAIDNNVSTNIGLANGSELDAAYGFISNGVLYLTIAGNFNSAWNSAPYNTLHTFFMSDAGGTNSLPTFSDGGFNGRRNNMVGMTFDTGFNPNHWIYVNSGSASDTNPITMYVDYLAVNSNGPYAFLGNVDPPISQPAAILTNVYFGNVMQFAMDNSNTGGVNATTCTTNETGALQSVAASAVRSGIEMAIPLATIGSPTGAVRVLAFVTDQEMVYIYNQALGPFNGAPNCEDMLGNTILTSAFDFNAYSGQQYFSFTVPPCSVIVANPTFGDFTFTGGVATVSTYNSGGCGLTVTASTNWITIVSGSSIPSGNGSFTYRVATNFVVGSTRVGQIYIRNTEPGTGRIVTNTVTVTQLGATATALSPNFEIDGIAEASYGCPIVVQQIGTGFGDRTTNALFDGLSVPGNSELDAAYGMIQNDVLFLTLAGNMEFNGNAIVIYLMTGPGGVSTLSTNNNQGIGGNHVRALALQGFTFDGGFAPNYCLVANGDHSPRFYLDFFELWPGGTNSAGVATNGYFVGSTINTNGTLFGGSNPFGIQGTINNSNTNGVDGNSCPTNTTTGLVQSIAAAEVRTGLEIGIPLTALGSPTGAIYVCAFVGGGGSHTYLSNQFLPSIGSDTNCQNNLTNTNNLNLAIFPSGPHYFAVGPQMRITGISRAGNNINVSYQTAASTNLTYQVQRASALTTNTSWSNVGGLSLGNGGVVTTPIINGATNNPAQFYRVRQTPLCP
jgi:hypothetical protein